MRALLVLAYFFCGCSTEATAPVVTEEAPVTSADGGGDAATDASNPCRCDFHWARMPESIACYTRGDCRGGEVCVPVLPLTPEPSCRFE